ncbi:PP2C family protein-serine/threonine phosphatase [Cellulomonas fimi]|uniref:PP2C family protein-serine/threonine phosphatase n=1 Tax=Cellulomonas fimi TaxID=1708 RepID=UPI001E3E1B9E|nr:SpoIIE family protein phosphatase [Cellulomonas fimi]
MTSCRGARRALWEVRVTAGDLTIEPDPATEAERVRWMLAVEAAGVGSFDWDLRTGRLEWDDQLLEIFGIARAEFGESLDDFNAALHPDDVARVGAAVGSAIARCGEYTAEYRVVRPDGCVRWVQARGKALAGDDGTAVRMLGAAYDTTDRHDGDARISRVLETMSAAFFLLDDEWRFRYVNAEAEKLLGRPRTDLLGGVIWELFPAAVGSPFEEHYRGAAESGATRAFEAYYPAPLDRWYEVRAWPGADGLSVYFSDCTQRRRSQDRLQLLGEVSDDLASTLDTEDAVARLARHLVPTLASWCLVTLSTDQRHLRDIGSWHADPAGRDTVARYARLRLHALSPTSYLHRALRTGEVVEVPDATREITGVLTGEAVDVLRELAPQTAYAVPLRARGRTVGAMTLFHDAERERLSPEDLTTVVQLADRAGLALDNARLYEEQRHIAESLQRALLTEPVEPEHLDVAVRYLPASRAAQVGGDWYDAFLQRDGATVLVVGDVVGHDTQAAAAMSQVRTLLRGIGYASASAPGALLEELDTAMRGLRVDTMATALVARLERPVPDDGSGRTRLRWSSAGHPPPLLASADGHVEVLDGGGNGPLLGLLAGRERPERQVEPEPGSVLLLYSDGLVERRGEHLRVGIERLRQALQDAVARHPLSDDRGDLERVVDEVVATMLDGDADDDVAVVAAHLRAARPAA